jgi:D-arabinose 1-dehydrogenase-like Zn-dependent alcohol dehydrogenase
MPFLVESNLLDYKNLGIVLSEVFPLEDIDKAYEKVANGQVRFRAVIKS